MGLACGTLSHLNEQIRQGIMYEKVTAQTLSIINILPLTRDCDLSLTHDKKAL